MVQFITLSVDDLEAIIKRSVLDALGSQNPSNQLDDDEFFTRKETARKLHISLGTLDSYSKLGLIKAEKIGHRVLYKKSEINEALREKINSIKFKSK
ncbi:helix-turn-helix domain-containing protein [Moheibacter sediminis]|uniref:Helix-turn-helix domain-containing protein n=1 Tax=Moheibacter sediminis TaxID=1434700 RepID=A0A1W2BRD6_9FLAO|nr:helix-turn-helix domain-containing protein [Moheibacter sediminis]SMC75513.1 hypothetical protein SAMN06296427_10775 [Moheibacter sediminis]